MKFSLDILFILLKDFLVSQGEKEMAEKISQLIESNEKDLLDIRKAVKFTDILKCFFKQNPSLKKLINTKSEQIIEKLTKQNEESDEEDSDTEEDPVEEVKQPVKKVTTTNGKPQPQQNNNKTVKVQPTNEVQNEDRDTQLLGNKTERKPFQRIDETLKEKLPEVLKNNSYDHFSKNFGDEFGKPANDKLKFNKGKDFRKEKTKFKNKMSFGGQKLSTEVRSIRLDEDDE